VQVDSLVAVAARHRSELVCGGKVCAAQATGGGAAGHAAHWLHSSVNRQRCPTAVGGAWEAPTAWIPASRATGGLHGIAIALMAMHATSSAMPNTALFAEGGEAATYSQRGGPAAAARRAHQAGGLDRKGGAGGVQRMKTSSCTAPRAGYAMVLHRYDHARASLCRVRRR
jgi:hypothetical protein